MKKYTRILVLLMALVFFVSGFGIDAYAYSTAEKPDNKRVVDDADLLSSSEEEALDRRCETLSEKYKVDLVIVFKDEPVSSRGVVDDADMFFEGNGYGYTSAQNGIELYVNMYARDICISTMGNCVNDVFTDYGAYYIQSAITSYLSNQNYYKAADRFLDLCDEFLDQGVNKGKAYSEDNKYLTKAELKARKIARVVRSFGIVIVFFLIGLIIAGVKQASMVGQMNTINSVYDAEGYEDGGLKVTHSDHKYTRTTTSRTYIGSSSSSGGGGRSSSGGGHYSSGGGYHGGSHGKF